MIVSFSYPSTYRYGGGVAALYEYANGLARRGHQVQFFHGPTIPDLIQNVEEVGWFRFEPTISHHVVASLEDPSLPPADVIFQGHVDRRLGQPAVLIQGYRLLAASFERPAFRARCPKFCVARWLIDIGVAWGSPREQMHHVPLGIDQDRFRVRRPDDDRPVDVAMLFSDHPLKGGADGLEAIGELTRRRPGLRVEMFGMVAPAIPVPDNVTVRVAPTQVELAEQVYARAKVFLQPSWQEGFGLTAVEAMAGGCALVTTDNGGSGDYAFDDRTAAVVPPRCPLAAADAIDALLADEPRRIRLAEAGSREVLHFDWDVAAQVLESHLVRYLADPEALQRPPRDAPLHLDATR